MKFRLIFLYLISFSLTASTLMEPTSVSKDLYQIDILDGKYNPSIDKPDEFLDFEYATRVASPEQITSAITKWQTQSNKLKVVEYARSHENRPLHAIFISSPKNLKNLEEIKKDVTKLSNPLELSLIHISEPTRTY